MTDSTPTPPEVGTEILMQVGQASTRTTLFPDQSIVATVSPEFVEILFLRNELMIPAQKARVRSHNGNAVDLEVVAAPVVHQLTDIGHIRLPLQAATDLSMNLLKHLTLHHALDLDEFRARLTEFVKQPTSPV